MTAIAESLWPVSRAVRALRSNGPNRSERIGTRQRPRAGRIQPGGMCPG
jgi:hypothetical protein